MGRPPREDDPRRREHDVVLSLSDETVAALKIAAGGRP